MARDAVTDSAFCVAASFRRVSSALTRPATPRAVGRSKAPGARPACDGRGVDWGRRMRAAAALAARAAAADSEAVALLLPPALAPSPEPPSAFAVPSAPEEGPLPSPPVGDAAADELAAPNNGTQFGTSRPLTIDIILCMTEG